MDLKLQTEGNMCVHMLMSACAVVNYTELYAHVCVITDIYFKFWKNFRQTNDGFVFRKIRLVVKMD